nr:replication protein A 70 kDa DNA-binding subunit B [Tanacetum cinerariifolium]
MNDTNIYKPLVDVDVAECEAKDFLQVEVQNVTAHRIGVNPIASSFFKVKYSIKLDALEDQVDDSKVEDYQVDESEVDDVAVSEPQVDEANVVVKKTGSFFTRYSCNVRVYASKHGGQGNNNDIHKTCDKQPTTLDNSMDPGCHSSSGNRIGKNRKISHEGSCVWDVKMTKRSKSRTTSRSFNLGKSVVRRRRKTSSLDGNCDVLLDEYIVELVYNASSDGNVDVGREETGMERECS